MKKYSVLIAAAVLALLLAGGITARMYGQKKQFDWTVAQARKTSEGYDKDFINMVNRLEVELADRASFGYSGGKDPMTGKMRTVVTALAPSQKATKTEGPQEEIDPYKLTAIIYDDVGNKYTAIVMMDERSFSVEVNDKVGDRKILKITKDRIYMESETQLFYYDISGKKGKKSKDEAGSREE